MTTLNIEEPQLSANRPFDLALICPLGHRQWLNVDEAAPWARRIGTTILGACPECGSNHAELRVISREAIFHG